MKYVFYCPIVLYRFYNILPEDLFNEYMEDWYYDEISNTADFEKIVCQEIDCLNDRIQSISDIPGKMRFQAEFFGSSLWLKVEVQTETGISDDSIRDKTAEVIQYSMMGFGFHADGEDTIIVDFAFVEETSCAAPYYEVNQLLTEYEAMTQLCGSLDIHTSPDFQCDQTDGFPTSLCVCWEKGKAWLALNESMIQDRQDVSEYEQMCADFGIRDCSDEDDFNRLLKELGEDAYQSAALYTNEDEGMVM